jgi:hypothetical protein
MPYHSCFSFSLNLITDQEVSQQNMVAVLSRNNLIALERIIVEQFPRLFWGLPISIEAPTVLESQTRSLSPDYCIALLRIFKKTGVICCQSFSLFELLAFVVL